MTVHQIAGGGGSCARGPALSANPRRPVGSAAAVDAEQAGYQGVPAPARGGGHKPIRRGSTAPGSLASSHPAPQAPGARPATSCVQGTVAGTRSSNPSMVPPSGDDDRVTAGADRPWGRSAALPGRSTTTDRGLVRTGFTRPGAAEDREPARPRADGSPGHNPENDTTPERTPQRAARASRPLGA